MYIGDVVNKINFMDAIDMEKGIYRESDLGLAYSGVKARIEAFTRNNKR